MGYIKFPIKDYLIDYIYVGIIYFILNMFTIKHSLSVDLQAETKSPTFIN